MKPTFRTAVAVVTVAALTLAGCGAPEYQYPKSAAHNLYFKVPSAWQPLDQDLVDFVTFGDPASLKSQKRRAGGWAAAYDSSPQPSISHLAAGSSASAPTVHAFVRPLDTEEQGVVSFDLLRDLVLPVTEPARAQAAADPTFAFTDFELVGEQVVSPEPGLRGVRLVYNYRSREDNVLSTYDQLLMTNDATNLLYGLIVQCSSVCYLSRQEEIKDVVSSFTVRSQA